MSRIMPLPLAGTTFLDVRDEGRSMRLSWHEETATFVLSMWHDNSCVGSCHLAAADAPRLVHTVTAALAGSQPIRHKSTVPRPKTG